MKRLLVVLLAVLAGSAAARVSPAGIAGLYEDGSGLICTGALVSDPRLGAAPVILTAGHCVRDNLASDADGLAHSVDVSFDGGATQFKVKLVRFGDPAKGMDYAVLAPFFSTFPPTIVPYRLSTRTSLEFGEPVETFGFPQGFALSYGQGYVAQVRNPRLSGPTGGEWLNYPALYLPAAPGSSGSPIFDAAGEIVAVLSGADPKGMVTQIFCWPVSKLPKG